MVRQVESWIDWKKTVKASAVATFLASAAFTGSGVDTPSTVEFSRDTTVSSEAVTGRERVFSEISEIERPKKEEENLVALSSGTINLPDSRNFNLVEDKANYLINPQQLDTFVEQLVGLRALGYETNLRMFVNASDEATLDGTDANLGQPSEKNRDLADQYAAVLLQAFEQALQEKGLDDVTIESVEAKETILSTSEISVIQNIAAANGFDEDVAGFIDSMKEGRITLTEAEQAQMDSLLARSGYIVGEATNIVVTPGVIKSQLYCLDEIDVLVTEENKQSTFKITPVPMFIFWPRRRKKDKEDDEPVINTLVQDEDKEAKKEIADNGEDADAGKRQTLGSEATADKSEVVVIDGPAGPDYQADDSSPLVAGGPTSGNGVNKLPEKRGTEDKWAKIINRHWPAIALAGTLAVAGPFAASNWTYCPDDPNPNDPWPQMPSGFEANVLIPDFTGNQPPAELRIPLTGVTWTPDWLSSVTMAKETWDDCSDGNGDGPIAGPVAGPSIPICDNLVRKTLPDGSVTEEFYDVPDSVVFPEIRAPYN